MPFGIPNEAVATFLDQAEPDSVDFDILTAAFSINGVVSGCAVTSHGADMTPSVAAGTVVIAGTTHAVTGGTVTVTAADLVNPRFDLVVVNNTGAKSVVAGSPSVNPVFPVIPANSVVLAAIYVPVGTTSINAGRIVDKRVMLVLGATGAPIDASYITGRVDGRLTLGISKTDIRAWVSDSLSGADWSTSIVNALAEADAVHFPPTVFPVKPGTLGAPQIQVGAHQVLYGDGGHVRDGSASAPARGPIIQATATVPAVGGYSAVVRVIGDAGGVQDLQIDANSKADRGLDIANNVDTPEVVGVTIRRALHHQFHNEGVHSIVIDLRCWSPAGGSGDDVAYFASGNEDTVAMLRVTSAPIDIRNFAARYFDVMVVGSAGFGGTGWIIIQPDTAGSPSQHSAGQNDLHGIYSDGGTTPLVVIKNSRNILTGVRGHTAGSADFTGYVIVIDGTGAQPARYNQIHALDVSPGAGRLSIVSVAAASKLITWVDGDKFDNTPGLGSGIQSPNWVLIHGDDALVGGALSHPNDLLAQIDPTQSGDPAHTPAGDDTHVWMLSNSLYTMAATRMEYEGYAEAVHFIGSGSQIEGNQVYSGQIAHCKLPWNTPPSVIGNLQGHGLVARTEVLGSATGDGTTKDFPVAHGLFTLPRYFSAQPASKDAANQHPWASYVDADKVYGYVHYSVAPPSGADLKWDVRASV